MTTKQRVSGRTATLQKQRKIQAEVERGEKKSGKAKEKKGGVQTGSRRYPANPMPEQHQQKPGIESGIRPRPMFANPDYFGSEKLKDMVALITGGDSGIGRSVAVLFAREGANVAIVYLAADEDAQETQRFIEEDEGGRCILIKGDVTDSEFCGGLDILVSNAAFHTLPGSSCR